MSHERVKSVRLPRPIGHFIPRVSLEMDGAANVAELRIEGRSRTERKLTSVQVSSMTGAKCTVLGLDKGLDQPSARIQFEPTDSGTVGTCIVEVIDPFRTQIVELSVHRG